MSSGEIDRHHASTSTLTIDERPADRTPAVCIGLPVYNGAERVAQVLRELLTQDFTDFELHICDNGSTDSTEAICHDFASRDKRIYYHRSDVNLGAVANFNRAFAYCRSQYFMFAADDDVRETTYLGKCVRMLDSDSAAVLCSSVIDSLATPLRDSRILEDCIHTVGMACYERYCFVLRNLHCCSCFYGLMRANAYAATGRYRDIWGPDFVALCELSLQGTFVKVPERLYHRCMDDNAQVAYARALAVVSRHAAEETHIFARDLDVSGALEIDRAQQCQSFTQGASQSDNSSYRQFPFWAAWRMACLRVAVCPR